MIGDWEYKCVFGLVFVFPTVHSAVLRLLPVAIPCACTCTYLLAQLYLERG